METKDYLKILKEEIHSAVFATVDEKGLPVTRVIDIMLTDDDSLYFITAKGKEFYRQLTDKKFVAVSGMTDGEGSLSKKAISVRGRVEELGNGLLDRVFEHNPYMEQIYPEKESRVALTAFRMWQGEGEYFDLSTKPITRHSFFLGKDQEKECLCRELSGGYRITDRCNGCGVCYDMCPQKCISTERIPYVIRQEHCLHCGNCLEMCPAGAVQKRQEG